MTGDIEIRSYRVVFDLERRIHRVDRFRIPLPYGLPVRSVGYFVAALAAVLTAQRLPGSAALAATLPTPLRDIVLPAGVAIALTRARIDGRCAHHALVSWGAWRCRPRRLARFCRLRTRADISDLSVVPDEHGVAHRRALLRGPGSVLLRYPVAVVYRGRQPQLQRTADHPLSAGHVVDLAPGQEVHLR